MTVDETNKRAQAEATNSRSLNRMNWTGGPSQILIGIMVLLLIIVTVTIGKPNLFWSLMLGVFAMWTGGKLGGVKNTIVKKALGFWPKAITTMGTMTVVGVLLLQSGFGQLLESTVESVDQKMACMADKESEACKLAMKSDKNRSPYSCDTNQPFDFNHVMDESKDYVLLHGETSYLIRVPPGRRDDFRYEFAENPLPSQPSFKLGPADLDDFIRVDRHSDGNSYVRIYTDAASFRRRVNNMCLGFYVWVE